MSALRLHALRARAIRFAALSLALTVCGAATAATANAQLLGKLGRKATEAVEQKANQKVDEKIDQAAQKLVDHSFDSAFGPDNTSGKDSGGKTKDGGSSHIFSMLPNAPTEDHYDFDVVFTYEVENFPKGKPSDDKALVVMNFDSQQRYAGTRIAPAVPKKDGGEVFAIFDVKNESMVMLMASDKDKVSMAYSWKDAKKYSAPPPEKTAGSTAPPVTTTTTTPAKPITFSSLGKRTIAGYSAEGYKGEDEDGEMEVWVSRDPSLSYSRMMGASSSMKQMRGVMPDQYPVGMLMEVTSTDKKTGDKGRMTIKSIDTRAKVHIDMTEYPRLGKAKTK